MIEEAHRLLPNIQTNKSSEEANARGKAVETFVNLLAEIRSYGEGIIIADQIASKLHSDIVKNTNIKILQRTMDKEDRELVGNSINLNENQILDIAELKAGQAIVHNRDIHQAFMVQIDRFDTRLANEEEFANFNNRFLESQPKYQYEFINEERFYIPYYNQQAIRNIDKSTLANALLDFINAALFDKNLQIAWKNFASLLKVENTNEYGYLFVHAWDNLKIISNHEYYANIDAYLDTYKAALALIMSCSEDSPEIEKRKERLQKRFYHENTKIIFKAMNDYNEEEIDWTLIVLENLTSKPECLKQWKNIDHSQSFDALKVDLEVLFQTKPQKNLTYCAQAIYCNDSDINLTTYKEQ